MNRTLVTAAESAEVRKHAAAFWVRMELPEGWQFRGRHWNTRSEACASTNSGSALKLTSCLLSGELRIAGLRVSLKVE
jgi:hypothetical protein